MKNLIAVAIPFAILLFLITCQSKVEVVEPDTELIVYVKDSNGILLNGAKVAIFSKLEDYKKSSPIFSTKLAFDTAISRNGKCTFSRVNPDKPYWIAGYLKDSITYKSWNESLYHDNSQSGYELIRPLNKSSQTTISIILEQAENFVVLYADNSIPNTLPISIKLDNDSLPPIIQNLATAPIAILKPGTITKKMRVGTHSYYFRNSIGCTTIEQFMVTKGNPIFINSNTCQSGYVYFYTGPENGRSTPISIVLNSNTVIDSIKTVFQSAPANCDTKGIVKYALPPGDYTYFAKSLRDSCAWAGKFNIQTSDCKPIKLERCK